MPGEFRTEREREDTEQKSYITSRNTNNYMLQVHNLGHIHVLHIYLHMTEPLIYLSYTAVAGIRTNYVNGWHLTTTHPRGEGDDPKVLLSG